MKPNGAKITSRTVSRTSSIGRKPLRLGVRGDDVMPHESQTIRERPLLREKILREREHVLEISHDIHVSQNVGFAKRALQRWTKQTRYGFSCSHHDGHVWGMTIFGFHPRPIMQPDPHRTAIFLQPLCNPVRRGLYHSILRRLYRHEFPACLLYAREAHVHPMSRIMF